MHGQIFGAVHANAFGVFLFAMTLASMPISLRGVVTGESVMDVLDRIRIERWAVLVSVISLTVWCVRIATLLLMR